MNFMRISSIAVIVISMVALVSPAHAQNTVGTITQLAGAANIERAGKTAPAAVNMPVMLHDKIITQPKSSLTITMVDDSNMQLGDSTTLTIDESYLVNGVGAPRKVGLLEGALHSVIKGAMKGSATTFEVHTPNAVGAVRGTEFTVRTHTDPAPNP